MLILLCLLKYEWNIYLQSNESKRYLNLKLDWMRQKPWYRLVNYETIPLFGIFFSWESHTGLQVRKMDLEARGLQPNIKAVLLAKLREYKSDLNNLKSEVKRIASTNLNQAARDELLEAGLADTLAVRSWLCFASLFYSLYYSFQPCFLEERWWGWWSVQNNFFLMYTYAYIF